MKDMYINVIFTIEEEYNSNKAKRNLEPEDISTYYIQWQPFATLKYKYIA